MTFVTFHQNKENSNKGHPSAADLHDIQPALSGSKKCNCLQEVKEGGKTDTHAFTSSHFELGSLTHI